MPLISLGYGRKGQDPPEGRFNAAPRLTSYDEAMRRYIWVLAALVLVLSACSSSSGSDGSGEEAADSDNTTSTTEAVADVCVTDLEVVNGSAETSATVPDGTFEAVTMWADKAPHPDNTVDYDQQLDLAFFTYEFEPDEQFGVSIPIDPDTPDGEHFISLALSNPDEPVAAGQRYVDALDAEDDPDADGEISFTFWEYGSDRLLPGGMEITITEVTDDQVCGEITTQTETDLQQFIGIDGTFVTNRSQALEAADDE